MPRGCNESSPRIDSTAKISGQPASAGRRATSGSPNLHRAPGNVAEAEACFTKALDVARARQSLSLVLRAAVSLARLWQGQGKTEEAHDLLAPVYIWFTGGFDTADLKTLRRCWTS